MFTNVIETAIDFVKQHPQATIAALSCIALLVFSRLRRKRSRLRLQGPPSASWIFGVSKDLFQAMNVSPTFVVWSKTYGPAYKIPLSLGDEAIVLVDPKAISTFFERDTSVYQQGGGIRAFFRRNVRACPKESSVVIPGFPAHPIIVRRERRNCRRRGP